MQYRPALRRLALLALLPMVFLTSGVERVWHAAEGEVDSVQHESSAHLDPVDPGFEHQCVACSSGGKTLYGGSCEILGAGQTVARSVESAIASLRRSERTWTPSRAPPLA